MFFDSLSKGSSIFCPLGRATSRVVVFQVSCRGTGGDHSTSEPVDAEDGDIDIQRGTNGEPTWNQRGTNGEPTGNQREATGLWMISARNLRLWNCTIVSQHEKCMCVNRCQKVQLIYAYIKPHVLAVGLCRTLTQPFAVGN